MADRAAHVARLGRYGLVGLLNTVVGLTVIYALDLGLHAPPELANLAGYAAGLSLSFGLNRSFVFRNKQHVAATGPRYIVAIVAAFLLNQLVLGTGLAVLGPGALQHALAQLAGMAAYTISSFLACQFWVFRNR